MVVIPLQAQMQAFAITLGVRAPSTPVLLLIQYKGAQICKNNIETCKSNHLLQKALVDTLHQ